MGVNMSLDEVGHRTRELATEDRHFYGREEPEDHVTPARRAALEALEREFRDLLGTTA